MFRPSRVALGGRLNDRFVSIWPNRVGGLPEICCEAQCPPDAQPLTLVSYEARDVPQAYLETLALGDELPRMPLFLQPSWYVSAPLEASYQTAYRGVPEFWRDVLDA